MSYHHLGGPLPPMTSTQSFVEAVDPYSWRFSPPGAVFSPYGWGPDFNIGMPMNYTHHLDYQRVPIQGARRNIGPMYDRLWPKRYGVQLSGSWSGSAPGYEPANNALGGVLAVL